jgi:NAD(P)H-nitrite reductase large subunit
MAIAARVKDSLAVKAPDWFEENSITLRLSAFVRSIDPNAKQVTLSDGSKLSYDKLIYALGAECFIPPIKGTDKNGVFSIRYLRDVYSIWERLPKAKNAVVIGGGVLGLEAAAELKKMRLSVTVLETAPALMSRQLDADTSAQLIKSADEYGIRIFTGANIVSIDGDISVAGVTLSDGTVFPADIVVVSCGARANIEPALTAGIGCGRAVKVSPYMQTDIPDIYACGDCAELEGMNFQLWAEASEQGRIAGANAAGDKVKYTAVPYGASFDGMNTSLYAIGDVGKEGKDYKLLETRDEIARSFAKYFFADGRLCGGILYGDTSAMQHLTDALNAKLDYVSFKRSL